jgi:hypothetical protein
MAYDQLGWGSPLLGLRAGTPLIQETLALGTRYTREHGLGQVPVWCLAYLENKTADLGYVPGDRVYLASHQDNVASGVSVSADHLVVSLTTNNTTIHVLNKTSGVTGAITVGNWRITVIPFAIDGYGALR